MDRRPPSLFLAGEASAVIAALRSNLKFNRYAVCRPGPIGASISPSCLPCQQPGLRATPGPAGAPRCCRTMRWRTHFWRNSRRCAASCPPGTVSAAAAGRAAAAAAVAGASAPGGASAGRQHLVSWHSTNITLSCCRLGGCRPSGVPDSLPRDDQEPRNQRAHHPRSPCLPQQNHQPRHPGCVPVCLCACF